MSGDRKEFGGPAGNVVLIAGLPLLTAYLFYAVRFNHGTLLPHASADALLAALMPTWQSLGVYVGWLALQAALQHFAPGRRVRGEPLPSGQRLPYRMNGLFSMGATFALAAALHGSGLLSLRVLYDELGAILTISTFIAFAFSGFLYVYGRRTDPGPSSGSRIHDFWMGTAHNPRIPARPEGFDLKLFCEARPGLLLWALLNASFAVAQYEKYGFVSTSMILVNLFQLLYIVDYFWHEEAILTTMDIKHERFGFMLAFGDLVWVPMTYTLQGQYLVDHVHDLSLGFAAVIVLTNLLGYSIFRSVNLQKHNFRKAPDNARIWGRPAKYIRTKHGTPLLVSGFWGWSRHFNYVGDILMAISWSLPCLFGAIVPYFYPIYFAALLIHRERRDHDICKKKYGKDWERYCTRVPYRIIPGLY